MAETLQIPGPDVAWLAPRLPSESAIQSARSQGRPFVTLTFATSLDSSLSLAPGVRTRLSGSESKAMTHHLRRHHAAILVGVGTVLADDPGLNCRIHDANLDAQPRPIVLDPRGRWDFTEHSKVFEVARANNGLAPFVLVGPSAVNPERKAILEAHGGKFVILEPRTTEPRFDWPSILSALHAEGLESVMIEGGGQVINSLLDPAYHRLVDRVIVTIAPTWLGRGGVVVSPDRVQNTEGMPVPAARLTDVAWHQFGEDIVLSGQPKADMEDYDWPITIEGSSKKLPPRRTRRIAQETVPLLVNCRNCPITLDPADINMPLLSPHWGA